MINAFKDNENTLIFLPVLQLLYVQFSFFILNFDQNTRKALLIWQLLPIKCYLSTRQKCKNNCNTSSYWTTALQVHFIVKWV